MNVLVACEESQRVCLAFREKGHNAFSCDIQSCSGGHPEWHIKGNVTRYLNGFCTFLAESDDLYLLRGKWDLIIGHPPCTYLSAAGAVRMYHPSGVLDAERYKLALVGRDFFLSILNADCDRICVENPRPLRVVDLPKESQRIQPYMFGDPYKKLTYLWLKGLPALIASNPVDPVKCWVNAHPGSGVANTAKMRSKTFPGIASAMAEQWGCVL